MITIEEIGVEKLDEFWLQHLAYLIEDDVILENDIDYFSGDEYRNTIKQHMNRSIDKHPPFDLFH